MESVTFEVSGVDGALSTVRAQVCETAAGPIRVVSLLREDGSAAARLVGVREIGVLLGYSKGGYNLYQHLLDNLDLAGYSEPARGRRRGSEVLVERGDGVYLHRGLLGGYLDLFSDDLGWGEKRRLEFLHLDTAGTIVAGLLHRKGAATLSVALHALAKELKEGDKARAAEAEAWQEAVTTAEEAGQIVAGVVREEAKDNAAWEARGLQTNPIHPSIIEDARLPPPSELEAEAERLADLLQAGRAMREAEVAQQEEACVNVDVKGAVALLRAAAGVQGRPKREAWEASVREQVNQRNVSSAMSGRDRIDALIATSDALCRLHNADLLEDCDGLREAAECIKDALLFEVGLHRNPPLPMEGPIPADVWEEDEAWGEAAGALEEGEAVALDPETLPLNAKEVRERVSQIWQIVSNRITALAERGSHIQDLDVNDAASPWARIKTEAWVEPTHWHDRFGTFLRLGRGRDLSAAMNAWGEGEDNELRREWHQAARNWAWHDRATSFDAFVRRRRDALEEGEEVTFDPEITPAPPSVKASPSAGVPGELVTLGEAMHRAFEPVRASIDEVRKAAQEVIAALHAAQGTFEHIKAAERVLEALGTTQAEQLEHMRRLSAALTLPNASTAEPEPTERRWTALMISKTLKRDFPERHAPSAQHIGGVADRIGVKRSPLAVAKPILINTAKGQVERQEWHYTLAAVMRIVSELGYGDVARRETFAGAEVPT